MTDAEHAAVLRRWLAEWVHLSVNGPNVASRKAAIERAIELLDREAARLPGRCICGVDILPGSTNS